MDSLTGSVKVLKASDRDYLSLLTVIMQNTSPTKSELNSIENEFRFPIKKIKDLKMLDRRLKDESVKFKVLAFLERRSNKLDPGKFAKYVLCLVQENNSNLGQTLFHHLDVFLGHGTGEFVETLEDVEDQIISAVQS